MHICQHSAQLRNALKLHPVGPLYENNDAVEASNSSLEVESIRSTGSG